MDGFLIPAQAKKLGKQHAYRIETSLKPDEVVTPHPTFDADKKKHKVMLIVVKRPTRTLTFKEGDYLVDVFGTQMIVPGDKFEAFCTESSLDESEDEPAPPKKPAKKKGK